MLVMATVPESRLSKYIIVFLESINFSLKSPVRMEKISWRATRALNITEQSLSFSIPCNLATRLATRMTVTKYLIRKPYLGYVEEKYDSL